MYVTPNLNCFTTYIPYTGADQLRVGNEKGLIIIYIGSTQLVTNSGNLVLTDLWHVPSISKSLPSISHNVSNNNVCIEFNTSACFVKDQITQ
jgi:hypothetical protein